MNNLHASIDNVEKEVRCTADMKRKGNICKNLADNHQEGHWKAAKERMENLHSDLEDVEKESHWIAAKDEMKKIKNDKEKLLKKSKAQVWLIHWWSPLKHMILSRKTSNLWLWKAQIVYVIFAMSGRMGEMVNILIVQSMKN